MISCTYERGIFSQSFEFEMGTKNEKIDCVTSGFRNVTVNLRVRQR